MATNNALNVQGPTPLYSVTAALANSVTGDNTSYTIQGGAIEYNYGSTWNATTSIFTAPQDGVYLLSGKTYTSGYNGSQVKEQFYVELAGHNPLYELFYTINPSNIALSSAPTDLSIPYNRCLRLDAGDTVQYIIRVGVAAGDKTITVLEHFLLQCSLLFAV